MAAFDSSARSWNWKTIIQTVVAGILLSVIGWLLSWIVSLNHTIADNTTKIDEQQMQIDDMVRDIKDLQESQQETKDNHGNRLTRLETIYEFKK